MSASTTSDACPHIMSWSADLTQCKKVVYVSTLERN